MSEAEKEGEEKRTPVRMTRTLTLKVQDSTPSSLAYYFALLDGGAGTDTCITGPSKVKVINCEL